MRWSSELSEGQWVAEGNSAVKAHPLRAARGFNADLERIATDSLSGEGIVCGLLRSQGAVARLNPNAIIEHLISVEQLTMNWLFRHWFLQGQEGAIKDGDNPEWPNSLSGNAITLNASANQNHEQLSDEQILLGTYYPAFGFLCKQQGVQ